MAYVTSPDGQEEASIQLGDPPVLLAALPAKEFEEQKRHARDPEPVSPLNN